MNLSDHYDGSNDPFEGDLTVYLNGLPVGARATKATVKLTSLGGPQFKETFDFSQPPAPGSLPANDFGVTETPPGAFIEVDFHARRTLAAVDGDNIRAVVDTSHNITKLAYLQVEIGGVYVEINEAGAIKSPGDDRFFVPSEGSLPGLIVNKFKLTRDAGNTKDLKITTVTIRSVPTNLTVNLGQTPPFWVRVGELAATDASPDFAEALNTFLLTASSVNGYYQIPFVVHSDTLARLDVELNIDYVIEQVVLPPHLPEITLPYNFSTLPGADEALTTVALSRQAIPVSGMSGAQVRGEFQPTRVRKGDVGEEPGTFPVRVAPDCSLAQAFQSDTEIALIGIDLPLASTQPGLAGINVALQADDDGKPSGEVLIRADVHIEKPLPGQSSWGSATLPSPFRILPDTRYWLVLQSQVGEAFWNATAGTSDAPTLQCSRDGGLSWRAASVTGAPAVLAALLRLRDKPDRFSIPVQLQIGKGPSAVRRRLDEFAPLGRIEFNFDFAEKLTKHLARPELVSPCGTGELIINGSFDQPPIGDATRRIFGFDADLEMRNVINGNVDLSWGVDLSQERFITLSIKEDSNSNDEDFSSNTILNFIPTKFKRIDCAGKIPFRTTLPEIIDAINKALGRNIAEEDKELSGRLNLIFEPNQGMLVPYIKNENPASWMSESGGILRVKLYGHVNVILIAIPPALLSEQTEQMLRGLFGEAISKLVSLSSTELTQHIPVSGGCHYLLQILLGSIPESGVEPGRWQIQWLDRMGQILRVDSATITNPDINVYESRKPQICETRVTAPINSVEGVLSLIRPSPGILALEDISFKPILETLTNTSFQMWDLDTLEKSLPLNWTRLSGIVKPYPIPKTDVLVVKLECGGPDDAVLSQSTDVNAGEPYELKVTARPEPPLADDVVTRPISQHARLELRWLDNGNQIGEPVILPLDGRDFPKHAWSGIAPDNATKAELRLIQPKGMGNLIVESVSFTRVDLVDVPLIFLAEAPGELNVSDLRVTYDLPEPPAPLRLPTPASGQAQARTRGVSSATSASVLPAVVTRPITDISGIGPGRAQRLAEAGIDSLEKLAKARPEYVAGLLNAVSVDMAARFIQEANGLITSTG